MRVNFHREVSLTLFYFFFDFPVEYLDLSCRFCYNLLWVIVPKTEQNLKRTVVKIEHFTAVFLYPKVRKEVAEMAKRNRTYHIAYKKAKNPDAYFRRYESQIILYSGARRVLEQSGIKLKGLNADKLRAEYQALESQKKELTATYKSCEKEVRDLKRKQENLNRYLGRTQTDPVQEQFKKKYNPIL